MKTSARHVNGMLHSVPGFSAELELLLCCGGPALQMVNRARLEQLSEQAVDWDGTFRLAGWHGMRSLLYWNLIQAGPLQVKFDIPSSTMQLIRDAYLRNVGTALKMTGDLLAIVDRMESAGVTVVPYKGPILSSRLYGNPTLRQSVDLDVVVRKTDLGAARKCLTALGYVPSVMLRGTNHEFQVDSRYSERFDRTDSVVELHWAFTNKDVAFPLTLDHLLARLETYSISGRPIRVFAADDMLLILCVHGAKHGWVRLEWICGVAELAASLCIDWSTVLERARETRSMRRLLLGLCLAHDLYRAPIPESVKKNVLEDGQVLALATAVSSALLDGNRRVADLHTFGTLEHDLFNFRLGDGFSDSFRYLAYRITTPSRPERWSTISVRGRPISLHSFTRPFGVVGKLVPAIWRRYVPSLARMRRNDQQGDLE